MSDKWQEARDEYFAAWDEKKTATVPLESELIKALDGVVFELITRSQITRLSDFVGADGSTTRPMLYEAIRALSAARRADPRWDRVISLQTQALCIEHDAARKRWGVGQ